MGVCISGQFAKTSNTSKSSMPKRDIKEGFIGRAQFIRRNSKDITDQYELEKTLLGIGAYGSVVQGRSKATNANRAIKLVSKAQLKHLERFKQEIAIMKMMDHPNIIKLFETFEDKKNIYLVMELCSGGELFDRIIDLGHFSEVEAAILMQQIIRAIYYMHESHVCHRDLKPQNFLFMTKDSNILKIIDFGFSRKFDSGQVLTTKAGSPHYVAPEVISGKYDQMSDLWSCGVIMYVMLCGYPPFFGDSDADVLAQVSLGDFSFYEADWKIISEDAKQLISCLLKMNPRDRFTAEQALNHEWIENTAPKANTLSLQSNFVDNLRSFRSQNNLQKAALHVIAGQLDESQSKTLRETFTALDENGDGQLTLNEMKEGIRKAGLKEIPPDLQQIMDDIDADGNGAIDYTEFLAATLDRHLYLQEDVCWAAFRFFDKNGDGKISQQELKAVLAGDTVNDLMGEKVIADILKEVATDGSENIDFEDFKNMMKSCGTPTAQPPTSMACAMHGNTAHSHLHKQSQSTGGKGKLGAIGMKFAIANHNARIRCHEIIASMTCARIIAQLCGNSCHEWLCRK